MRHSGVKFLNVSLLLVMLGGLTFAVMAQPLSVKDSIQDLKISTIESSIATTNLRVDALSNSVNDLVAAVNQAKGAIITMGVLMTFLQVINTVSAWRKAKN